MGGCLGRPTAGRRAAAATPLEDDMVIRSRKLARLVFHTVLVSSDLKQTLCGVAWFVLETLS